MEETIEDSLLQLITCSVCQEAEELKVLPCQHTICLSCVKQLPTASNTFKCPICIKAQLVPNGGYEQLPNSLMVQQIVDLVRKKQKESADKQTETQRSKGDEETRGGACGAEDVDQRTDPQLIPAEVAEAESKPFRPVNVSLLRSALQQELVPASDYQSKAATLMNELAAVKEKSEKDSRAAKESVEEYRKSVESKCKQKLAELDRVLTHQKKEIDSAIGSLKPAADQIQAAINATPALLSELSNENCPIEVVSSAQKLVEQLTDLKKSIDVATHDQTTNPEELKPGDSVCINYGEGFSAADMVNDKVHMDSVGLFIGYHMNLTPKERQLGVDTNVQVLVIFPEKHDWKGEGVQQLKKSRTKANLPGRGDRVRVKASVKTPHFSWKGVTAKESRGVLKTFDSGSDAPDGDLVVVIDFPEERGWKGLYSEIELVPGCGLEVGEQVRVKGSVSEPARGWGGITKSSVGKITKIEGVKGKEEVTVEFPECYNWVGSADELEIPPRLMNGDLVQVRLNVKTPQMGWEGVTHKDVGKLQKIKDDGKTGRVAQVKFPQRNGLWSCKLDELEPLRYPSGEGIQFPPNLNFDMNAAAEAFHKIMPAFPFSLP